MFLMESGQALKIIKVSQLVSIKKAEEELKVKFSGDYRDFLIRYGTMDKGSLEIAGTGKGYFNVVTLTKSERKLYGKVLDGYYVISNLGNGDLLIGDEKGYYEIDHASKKIISVGTKLLDYVKRY